MGSVAHLFAEAGTSGSGEHDAIAKPTINAIAAFRMQASSSPVRYESDSFAIYHPSGAKLENSEPVIIGLVPFQN
jgi:hypothetical protein